MKTFIARSPIGIFEFDEKGELVNFNIFSNDPEKALEEFIASRLGGVNVPENIEGQRLLRKKFREYALSMMFGNSNEDLNSFLSAFASLLSKKKAKGLIDMDKILVQAFNAAEDLDASNLFMERLKEWYSLHYPEIKLGQRELVDAVLRYGRRENFPDFKESSGTELGEEDIKIIGDYAAVVKGIISIKRDIESYVEKIVKEIAPNLSSLIDPFLAARFISLAGSLEKLARMPASSIQLLGAEKALFRHLKKQGKPPKYGILYMDRRIQNASAEKKGKIARVISSKLMLAARIDFYSGRVEERLKKELEEALKAI